MGDVLEDCVCYVFCSRFSVRFGGAVFNCFRVRSDSGERFLMVCGFQGSWKRLQNKKMKRTTLTRLAQSE